MRKDTSDIIALSLVPGLGTKGILRLLDKAGSASSVFELTAGEVETTLGRRFKNIDKLQSIRSSDVFLSEIEYIEKEGIKVITPSDKEYPKALVNIYDLPPVLFCRGNLLQEDEYAVAIIGSRKYTQYGLKMAEDLAFDLASRGVTVVSGLARGIDTAAHRGALKAGGRTIAVMGSGFKTVYPPENKNLFLEVVSTGAVLTEFASETKPERYNFPRRNRIVSGMVKGVIVVEAAMRSGALITVDFALEHGKDVFVVPGQVGIASSEGSNRLIQTGAKLITTASDVIEELGEPVALA